MHIPFSVIFHYAHSILHYISLTTFHSPLYFTIHIPFSIVLHYPHTILRYISLCTFHSPLYFIIHIPFCIILYYPHSFLYIEQLLVSRYLFRNSLKVLLFFFL
jgi:hypothetical protein